MTSGLERLPLTVLTLILEYLDRDYLPSLRAFACVSKICYLTSTHLLFRTIKISVSSRSRLFKDVRAYSNMLQRAAGFRHVRRLIVGGQLLEDDSDDHDFSEAARYSRHSPDISSQDRSYDEHLISFTLRIKSFPPGPDDSSVTAAYETDDIWKPLAELVKQLPSLRDLIYECSGQFPPCMLEALHQGRPRCRLHLNTFKLRSLRDSVTDIYELSLKTSPCLYSLRIHLGMSHDRVLQEIQDLNYEAMLTLVSGLAPNLTEVHVTYASWSQSLYGFHHWKGIRAKQEAPKSLSSLHCLEIKSGDHYIGKEEIENWSIYTDFSKLKSLKILSEITLDTMQCLVEASSFPCLNQLELRFNTSHLEEFEITEFAEAAQRFLCSLPPLSSLLVDAECCDLDMSSIITHHGPALDQLHLMSLNSEKRLRPTEVAQMGHDCPRLTDLAIAVTRTKGDAMEVATYKALGSFPNLQYLSLALDASNPSLLSEERNETPNDPSFDEFDQQLFDRNYYGAYNSPRYGHIRDAFINSALDSTLARSIFWAISSGKYESAGSLPLEKLRIQVTGGGDFGTDSTVGDVMDVVGEIGRCWIVERNPRDDRRNELLLTEVGRKEREDADPGLMREAETIYRRLWPVKQGHDGDWRDEWESWPLSISGA